MKTSEKRENNLSHLAIIMDGNGRWSEQKGLPREDGHKEGVESLRKLLRYIDDFKIPYLTVFSFSTDNWKRPKSEISNLMNSNGIEFMLFHGRGGSISRGGGKSNKAILSLPAECQNGRIRFTEQGEVINYRYGSSKIAKRHLEQIISAQITALHQNPFKDDDDNGLIKNIIDQSYKTYRKDIINEDGWHFLLNTTPINHISKIPITSRPASRKKNDEHIISFDDLRAIPWVFSWTQI